MFDPKDTAARDRLRRSSEAVRLSSLAPPHGIGDEITGYVEMIRSEINLYRDLAPLLDYVSELESKVARLRGELYESMYTHTDGSDERRREACRSAHETLESTKGDPQ